MQRALVHYPGAYYEEYFFSCDRCCGCNTYGSTGELLAHPGYSPDLINFLCDNYLSWVLLIGNSQDAVFSGLTIENLILAYGDLGTISDWVKDIKRGCPGYTKARHEPLRFDDLLRDNSVKTGMTFLRDLGLMLYSPDDVLRPRVTLQGSEYWVFGL